MELNAGVLMRMLSIILASVGLGFSVCNYLHSRDRAKESQERLKEQRRKHREGERQNGNNDRQETA